MKMTIYPFFPFIIILFTILFGLNELNSISNISPDDYFSISLNISPNDNNTINAQNYYSKGDSYIFYFGREVEMSEIYYKTPSKEKKPIEIGLFDTGIDPNIDTYYYIGSINSSKNHLIFFKPIKITYLTVRFDSDSELKPSDFQFVFEKNSLNRSYDLSLNHIFLDEFNCKNPLSIWRIPITMGIKKTADNILLPHKNISTHQKIVRLIKFIGDIKNGDSKPGNHPQNTILDNMGRCAAYSDLLLALSATQGIEGRFIAAYDESGGHSLVELNISNHWNLYDPNYGIFYTVGELLSNESNILSVDELIDCLKNNKSVIKNIIPLKRYELQNFLIPINSKYRENPLLPNTSPYTNFSFFLNSNPIGPIGPNNPMIFPFQLDMYQNTEGNFSGENDIGLTQKDTYLKGLEMSRWLLRIKIATNS